MFQKYRSTMVELKGLSRKPQEKSQGSLSKKKLIQITDEKIEHQKTTMSINQKHAQPEFEVKRKIWTKLNRIRTGHGISHHIRCFNGNCVILKHVADGYESQTISHIIIECSLRAFTSIIHDIH